MKIVRFDAGSGAQTGVVVDDAIVDLHQANSPLVEVLDIINGGEVGLARVFEAVERSTSHYALEEVRLLAPLPRPGKYLAIGMNYLKHQQEAERLGAKISKHQIWFNKQTTCIAGPYDEIDPGVTKMLDYEAELGVVIGKLAKGVTKAEAVDHIFGYVVANDVSARDYQFHSPTFTMGKSFDTHGPIGPWLVSADEISDPHNLDLRCFVNGEQRQHSNTSQLIHDIYEQIEYLSSAFTLEPGDLLATGTPEGVGVAMQPPVFLKAGDVVRCEIESIGAIENVVAQQ